MKPTADTGLSRTTIKLVFLTHAVATGSLFTRIPDLQQGLGIDAATLGLAFIGQPVGAITMFLFASRIVERFGTRIVLLLGLPAMVVGTLFMALASPAAALFAAIAGFSAVFAVTNVAMNVEADRVEAATGKRLMNTCHGLWSIGQLGVFLLGVVGAGSTCRRPSISARWFRLLSPRLWSLSCRCGQPRRAGMPGPTSGGGWRCRVRRP